MIESRYLMPPSQITALIKSCHRLNAVWYTRTAQQRQTQKADQHTADTFDMADYCCPFHHALTANRPQFTLFLFMLFI
jgi:hypothetical protein